jgi:hypothetical protein
VKNHPPKLITAALLAALLALPGCGPSSGGTGTGETGSALVLFGATAVNVCTASFAKSLGCPPTGSGAVPTSPDAQGSTMVNFSDTAQGGNISVAIQAQTIELSARCRGLHFLGDWGITASNDARFFGNYRIDNAGGSVPASLSVQSSAGGGNNELQVTIRDADGRVVLGPVTVQRVPAPAAPTLACP